MKRVLIIQKATLGKMICNLRKLNLNFRRFRRYEAFQPMLRIYMYGYV